VRGDLAEFVGGLGPSLSQKHNQNTWWDSSNLKKKRGREKDRNHHKGQRPPAGIQSHPELP